MTTFSDMVSFQTIGIQFFNEYMVQEDYMIRRMIYLLTSNNMIVYGMYLLLVSPEIEWSHEYERHF